MTASVLAAGVGNMFLSDDGFGVEVARVLQARPLPDGLRVIDAGIRGVHLAYDILGGCDVLVLVDAMQRGDPPGTLTLLDAGVDVLPGAAPVDGHALDPVAMLALVERLGGQPPRTFVVACEPAVLDAGVGLSAAVRAAVEPAANMVLDLVSEV